jgi:hypothetical protein
MESEILKYRCFRVRTYESIFNILSRMDFAYFEGIKRGKPVVINNIDEHKYHFADIFIPKVWTKKNYKKDLIYWGEIFDTLYSSGNIDSIYEIFVRVNNGVGFKYWPNKELTIRVDTAAYLMLFDEDFIKKFMDKFCHSYDYIECIGKLFIIGRYDLILKFRDMVGYDNEYFCERACTIFINDVPNGDSDDDRKRRRKVLKLLS